VCQNIVFVRIVHNVKKIQACFVIKSLLSAGDENYLQDKHLDLRKKLPNHFSPSGQE